MESKKIIEMLERQNYLLEKRYEILKSMICDIYDAVVPQKKICPICKSEIRCYIPIGKPKMYYNAQCPVCLGLERQRLLVRYMELYWDELVGHKIRAGEKIKLLHFAPEPSISSRFQNVEEIEYYPVDIRPDYPYHIVKVVDITDIPYSDDYFDLIICFHVMEYVEDEKKALEEVKRVLKHNGSAIFCDNINQEAERTVEDKKYDTPELREKYYENPRYLRRYGRDYIERFGSVWGNNIVKYCVDDLEPDVIKEYNLLPGEELCIYTK